MMAGKRETHTPGPYTDDLRGAHFVICGGCTEVMAVIPEPDLDGFGCVSADERGANMKRTKVTLNACKGIETETLEKDTVHIGIRTVAAEARADAAEALLEQAALELEEAGKVLCGVNLHGIASLMAKAAERYRAFLNPTDKESGG